MNLNVPIMALGVGGTVSAVAVSSVAISNQMALNSNDNLLVSDKALLGELNHSFDAKKFVSFYTDFDTKTINRTDDSRPLLAFKKGLCFDGLFKGAEFKRPEQEAPLRADLETIVPSNFAFGDDGPLMGCKLLKFSQAKNSAGFGYMGEITVQDQRFGMAIYSALTNLKNQETTDAEYWVFFMEKQSNRWTTVNSWRWTMSMKKQMQDGTTHQQQSFNTKPVYGVNPWQWSPSQPNETAKFFADGQDHSQLWDDRNSVYSGLWFGGTGWVEPLYDGSNERWALRERFNEVNVADPVKFLDRINLKQKGVWVSIVGHCSYLRDGDDKDPELLDGERNICFPKKDNSRPN